MDAEKRLVSLIGGPMDGYDEIEARGNQEVLVPGPHHRRGYVPGKLIPVYHRVSATRFEHSGYYDWSKFPAVSA